MGAIKSIEEVVRERVGECVEAAVARFGDAILPIYRRTDGGKPDHIASCILLRMEGRPLMLTAAHTLRRWAGETTLYSGNISFEPIMLTFDITKGPDGDWEKDRYDFAVAEISDELAARLGGAKYLTEADFSRHVGDGKGHAYMCFGYPNSKNKINPVTKKVVPQRLPYWSNAIVPPPTLLKKLKVSGEDHLFVDFDKKFSLDEDGMQANSPAMPGMSGGAIIDLGRISAGALAGDCNPLLAGLFIEFHAEHGAIVGTRLGPILQAIRASSGIRVSAGPATAAAG